MIFAIASENDKYSEKVSHPGMEPLDGFLAKTV